MKILRIQGKNLASIAGEFDIDFTTEPLRSSGIFAICGPTGSGKSTILDAICLALFNNTPRTTGIEGTKMPDVGQEYIQQGDRRQILRRGSTEALAAVEFIAVDGKSYRSVWRVWRANNKVNGKLQPAELRIYDLSNNTPITTGVTEAENKLTQLIGLNYNQFTRTILLAQNEFARFLKARKEEKAEVLEKLTGSEIYSVISNTVYTKTAAIRNEWKELSNQIGNIRLLTPEELATLQQQLSDLKDQEKSLQQKNEDIQRKIKWIKQLEQINKSKEEARVTLQEARQFQLEALPQAQWLQQIETVESSRLICREKTECTEQLNTQTSLLQQTEAELSELTPKVTQAIQLSDQQKSLVNKYTNDYNKLKPELVEARRLDVQLTNAHQAELESQQALNNLREKIRTQKNIQAHRNAQLIELKTQQEQLNDWFHKNSQHEPMCLNFSLIEGFLDSAYTIQQQIIENQTVLITLQQQLTTNEKLLESQHQETHKYTGQQEQLLRARQQHQEALALIPMTELRHQKERLQLQREQLMQEITLAEKIDKNQKEHDSRQNKLEQQQQVLVQTEKKLAFYQKEKATAEIKYNTLRHSLEQARLTLSENVTQLRTQLEENQPCPVCGSTHHPYTDPHLTTVSLFNSLEKEVRQYEEEYDHLKTGIAHLETEQKHGTENLIMLRQEINELSKEREGLQQQINNTYSNPNQTFNFNIPALKELFKTDQKELETIRQKESEWEERQQLLETTQKQLDEIQQKNDTLQKALQLIQEKMIHLNSEHSKIKTIIENLRTQQNDSLDKVTPLISSQNWRQRWESNHFYFKQELRTATQKWQIKSQQLEGNQKQELQLSAEYEENQKNLLDLENNESELMLLLKKRSEETLSLRNERGQLLQGQSADTTEQYWQQLLEKTSRDLEVATLRKDQLLTEAEQLKGKKVQLQIHLQQYQKRLESSTHQLEEWLSRYNQTARVQLSESTLLALLQVSSEEIQQERSRQNHLRDQVTTALATFQEREKQWALHLQLSDCPEQTSKSLTSLETQYTDLQQETERLLQLKTEVLSFLHTQEENQKQVVHLKDTLDIKAQLLNNWNKLDELIGSQSGYKFKEIAQGYTLDILLSYANKQLQELTPRYQLQRIPDELALQVIDHDLCDEARSVFSLSGGESFLVSLALALGLSSFSSRNHFEENLFIDEGFGTLDSETLQVVMEALERLRSQGRQVGIISHVQDLTERIPAKICLVKTGNGKSKVVLES